MELGSRPLIVVYFAAQITKRVKHIRVQYIHGYDIHWAVAHVIQYSSHGVRHANSCHGREHFGNREHGGGCYQRVYGRVQAITAGAGVSSTDVTSRWLS